MKERILIVDDDASVRRVLQNALRMAGYECEEAQNGLAALDSLKGNQFSLVLTDIHMPDMDGIELLKNLTASSSDLAIVMMTGDADVGTAVNSLKTGAYDFITKPLDIRTLPITISRALERRRLMQENREYQLGLERLVEERTAELLTTYDQTLRALASALDTRDSETQEHAERVVHYSVAIAGEMGLDGTLFRDIEWGAILHDVGKIGVPDVILWKPEKLTPEEWVTMKTHPEIGHRMLQGIPFLQGALPVVLHHHEKWDGSGYPVGLRGEGIPLGARIFAIADAFDAITSVRPYKPALPGEDAKAEIVRSAGQHFDPQTADAFVSAYDKGHFELDEHIKAKGQESRHRNRKDAPNSIKEALP